MKFSKKDVNKIYNNMNSTISKIKGNLEDITSQYNKLSTGSVWSGEAYENYIEKFKKIVDEFDGIKDELQKSADFLNDVSTNYNSLDNVIIDALKIIV